ncbi:MAG: hypothetical protein U0174_12875 [Polyangiaceae bacterium]
MTTDESMSIDVREFLRAHIASFEELEILVFLIRNEADVTTAQIEEALPIRASMVDAAILSLVRSSVAEEVGPNRYRYAPSTQALESTTRKLAQAYAERPVTVIKALTADAIDRLRSSAVHTFVDPAIVRKKSAE